MSDLIDRLTMAFLDALELILELGVYASFIIFILVLILVPTPNPLTM